MAEPAKKIEVDNLPGNTDSAPPGKPDWYHNEHLKGGGKSTPKSKDHLKGVPSESESLGPKEQSAGNASGSLKADEHENKLGQGYKSKILDESSIFRRAFATRRRKLLLGGGLATVLAALTIAFFGYLNVFKLDGLMSNVERRAFTRNIATLDNRSSKWTTAYIQIRMLDMGNNPDLNNNENLLFRSNRVDTNNPLLDWYKTLRASKFEQEVFEKHGIKFTSVVNANGQARVGIININGQQPIRFNPSQADLDRIAAGDLETMNRFFDGVERELNNSEARREIRRVVKDNTKWYEVWQRRQLRKAIQNMTGVRDWRFFENTRDEARERRANIRNKILEKSIPESIWGGKYARCLLGIDSCRPSRDVRDPQNRATAVVDSRGTRALTDEEQANREGREGNSPNSTIASDALRRILQSANLLTAALNVVDSLDMMTFVHENLRSLVKTVTIAKGIQAAGLYQVSTTSRDQMKTGELFADEVNDFMQVFATAASSDAWANVVEGKGNPSQTSNTGLCSPEYKAQVEEDPDLAVQNRESYAHLCTDEQIGNAGRSQAIQDQYNSSIGAVLGPVASAWGAANDGFFGPVINLIRSISSAISAAVNTVLQAVLAVLGLSDDMERFTGWLFGQVAEFFGFGPILSGGESGGTYFNWIMQGGAYTAESTSRHLGAAVTTNESRAAAQMALNQYQSEQQEQSSLYERVASLDNPDSLAHKAVFALSNAGSDPSATFASALRGMWSSVGNGFNMLSGGKAQAQAVDGYAASRFAAIETYDYPPRCYNMNIFTMTPLGGTNVREVFDRYNIEIPADDLEDLGRWDFVTNGEFFYDTIYNILGDRDDADDIAVRIYNCHLLDTAIRGSLGYPFGYKKDHGLDDVSTGAAGSTGVVNNRVFMIGDSLTVGMRDIGQLEQRLVARGWEAGTIEAGVGDTVDSALPTVDANANQIAESGIVIVALGTNPAPDTPRTTFGDKIDEMVARIRTYNPSAQIYWVNAYSLNSSYNEVDTAILAKSRSLNFTVIDWRAEARRQPSRYPFTPDGVHHTAGGYRGKSLFVAGSLSAAGGATP